MRSSQPLPENRVAHHFGQGERFHRIVLGYVRVIAGIAFVDGISSRLTSSGVRINDFSLSVRRIGETTYDILTLLETIRLHHDDVKSHTQPA